MVIGTDGLTGVMAIDLRVVTVTAALPLTTPSVALMVALLALTR